ncbi:MAG: hypothetical protein CL927_04155 [Deltaproteobacteria bacterium]|nr:hypothetical protein [Deltaproteobacteria bacterium]HCH62840.1 hypothetical protein [Deltaproteobacteria bacterium]
MIAAPQLLSGVMSILFPGWSAPGVFRSKASTRSVICTPVDQRQGAETHPDLLAEPHPRGAYFTRGLEVCSEKVFREGLRQSRDEAVLTHLESEAASIAQAVLGGRPDLRARSLLVEVHYPHGAMAHKIRFATQDSLLAAGFAVSDRRPLLTAQDVVVLSQLPPERAYAGACERYASMGSLAAGDALVAVLVRDPRQTDLQAGICADGRWMWLR